MTLSSRYRDIAVRSRTRIAIPAIVQPAGGMSKPDYDVGYAKPPRHSRFKKGQSGNPKGRPKGSKNFNTIVLEAMQKKVKVRTANGLKTMTSAEALMMKSMEAATKGDRRMIEKLFSWYVTALPMRTEAQTRDVDQDDPLSSGDQAILAAYRAMVLGESDPQEEGVDDQGALS